MNNKLMPFLAVLVLAACTSNVNTSQSPQEQASKQLTSRQHTEACAPINEVDVVNLFKRWNASLQTGQPKAVVENYAKRSILLPTLSGTNRLTPQEKEAYFVHFLASKPTGEVTQRQIDIGCNIASDSGLYTFTMAKTGEKLDARYTFVYQWDGQKWLIVSHHSSVLPADE